MSIGRINEAMADLIQLIVTYEYYGVHLSITTEKYFEFDIASKISLNGALEIIFTNKIQSLSYTILSFILINFPSLRNFHPIFPLIHILHIITISSKNVFE